MRKVSNRMKLGNCLAVFRGFSRVPLRIHLRTSEESEVNMLPKIMFQDIVFVENVQLTGH